MEYTAQHANRGAATATLPPVAGSEGGGGGGAASGRGEAPCEGTRAPALPSQCIDASSEGGNRGVNKEENTSRPTARTAKDRNHGPGRGQQRPALSSVTVGLCVCGGRRDKSVVATRDACRLVGLSDTGSSRAFSLRVRFQPSPRNRRAHTKAPFEEAASHCCPAAGCRPLPRRLPDLPTITRASQG